MLLSIFFFLIVCPEIKLFSEVGKEIEYLDNPCTRGIFDLKPIFKLVIYIIMADIDADIKKDIHYHCQLYFNLDESNDYENDINKGFDNLEKIRDKITLIYNLEYLTYLIIINIVILLYRTNDKKN